MNIKKAIFDAETILEVLVDLKGNPNDEELLDYLDHYLRALQLDVYYNN